MRENRIARRAVAVLALLTAAGCAAAPAPAIPPAPAASAATGELEALFRARADSARARFSEADARFMTDMIVHHAQALLMAGLAPTHGAGPQLRTLAARIVSAQRDEIALMQQWLRERGQPVPEIHIDGARLMVHGSAHEAHGHDHSGMPGMLTQAQLDELDRARGAEFERLMLRFMIEHHRGAIAMVHTLLDTDGAAQDGAVFRLASDIQVDQITEINRMEQMLAAMDARRSGS